MRSELLQLANRLAARGEPFVFATVVRREAPTSAQLGDAAVITAGGAFHGWLGGACTKDLIVREAAAVLERGAPRLVALTADPDETRRNGVRILPMTCHSGGTVEVYLDPQIPEQRLLLFGDSDVARSVARLAPELGFRVERAALEGEAPASVTRGEARASETRAGSPETQAESVGPAYVVIATYGEGDESALRRALSLSPPPAYVALVSSRRRFEAIRDALVAGGLDAAALDRVSAPAGLDIGAKTPGEIAVSILAEMVGVRRDRRETDATASRGADPDAPGDGAGPGAPGDSEAPAGTAIDPVCGMTVSTDVPHRAEYEGRTYWFCCDACRQRFLATPEMFASSYAG